MAASVNTSTFRYRISEFGDDELELLDEVIGGDIRGVRYQLKADTTKHILRYFNNDVLVAEMALTEKN